MTSIDHSIFRREKLTLDDLDTRGFDLFISAFNDSERVTALYDTIHADRKVSLVHAEYGYRRDELPGAPRAVLEPQLGLSAPQFWLQVLAKIAEGTQLTNAKIAIDITGMMRPHLVVLPYMLRRAGVEHATFYYSDPQAYVSGERTVFAKGPVNEVRLIPGLEGRHTNRPSPTDVLIIGAGYDHELIKAVAEDKPFAEQFVVFGLPSLQPHMYQESLIRVSKARESITDFHRTGAKLFAPASDPFATAQVLSDHMAKLRESTEIDHVYISPVGAKTQVLGFSWYYWCQGVHEATSVLFPFSARYERETSRGIAFVHEFEMELDLINVPMS